MRISALPSLPAPPLWLRIVLQAIYPLFGIVMSLLFCIVAPFLLVGVVVLAIATSTVTLWRYLKV